VPIFVFLVGAQRVQIGGIKTFANLETRQISFLL
jgi:hypothetical protein